MDNISQSFTGFMESLQSKGIIGTIVVGFIVGVLAKIIMPGKDPGGLILTTLLGIGGASVATWLSRHFGLLASGNIPEFVAAIIGALLILIAYKIIIHL